MANRSSYIPSAYAFLRRVVLLFATMSIIGIAAAGVSIMLLVMCSSQSTINGRFFQAHDDSGWHIATSQRFGSVFLDAYACPIGKWPGDPPNPDTRFSWYDRTSRAPSREDLQSERTYSVSAYGWPFIALYRETYSSLIDDVGQIRRGVNLDEKGYWRPRTPTSKLVWSGFIENAVVFAVVALIGYLAIVRLRSLWWVHRMQCARCGYVLGEWQARCPECGWSRPPNKSPRPSETPTASSPVLPPSLLPPSPSALSESTASNDNAASS